MVAAMQARPDLRWVAVDNWLPMSEQPEQYKATQDDNALKAKPLCDEHRQRFYTRAAQHQVSVLCMNTVAASMLFAEGSVDLVFVDADHSYEGVRDDIEAWLPKVRKQGWIGGHDYKNIDPRFGGVDKAVDERFPEVEADENYTWWVRV